MTLLWSLFFMCRLVGIVWVVLLPLHVENFALFLLSEIKCNQLWPRHEMVVVCCTTLDVFKFSVDFLERRQFNKIFGMNGKLFVCFLYCAWVTKERRREEEDACTKSFCGATKQHYLIVMMMRVEKLRKDEKREKGNFPVIFNAQLASQLSGPCPLSSTMFILNGGENNKTGWFVGCQHDSRIYQKLAYLFFWRCDTHQNLIHLTFHQDKQNFSIKSTFPNKDGVCIVCTEEIYLRQRQNHQTISLQKVFNFHLHSPAFVQADHKTRVIIKITRHVLCASIYLFKQTLIAFSLTLLIFFAVCHAMVHWTSVYCVHSLVDFWSFFLTVTGKWFFGGGDINVSMCPNFFFLMTLKAPFMCLKSWGHWPFFCIFLWQNTRHRLICRVVIIPVDIFFPVQFFFLGNLQNYVWTTKWLSFYLRVVCHNWQEEEECIYVNYVTIKLRLFFASSLGKKEK